MVNKALEPGVTWDKNNNHYMVSVAFQGDRIKLVSFPEDLVEMAEQCAREARQATSLIELEDVRMKFIQLRSEETGRRFKRTLKPLAGAVEEPRKREPRPIASEAPRTGIIVGGDAATAKLFAQVRQQPQPALTGQALVAKLFEALLEKQERFEEASAEVQAAKDELYRALPEGIRKLFGVEDIEQALRAERRGGVDGTE